MEKQHKPNYFLSVLDNRCPRCRTGKLFSSSNPYDLKNTVKMHNECPVCKQPTEIEVGFYYGTGYVSYALTVAFSISTLIAWWVLIGFSLHDNRFFIWMAVNSFLMIVLQPFFMRLSRILWLSWFVKYDPDWREKELEGFERIIPDQMSN
ncbi:MAG: DUF983 domain-containing protein [Chitinophagaceae bacterium]